MAHEQLADQMAETERYVQPGEPLSVEDRADLIAERKRVFTGEMDFAPRNGICFHRNIHKPGEPICKCDLVAYYGEEYPKAMITGCPECGASYCD
jgi:hypothetical protein